MSIDRPRLLAKYALMADSTLVDELFYWMESLKYWKSEQEIMNYHEIPDCLAITKEAIEDNEATLRLIERVIAERRKIPRGEL